MSSKGNALISVFDKTGIIDFARELRDMGWTIYASGGTAKEIASAGIQVHDTSKLVRGGDILGHRVVTLSREIYAGILADDSKEQREELEKLGIPRIDLVCVDMYPLKSEIKNPKANEKSIIEKTDVGGPTMLHAAAKGRRIVLSRVEQRTQVIDWLKKNKPNEADYLRKLAAIAEFDVAEYMIHSSNYLNGDDAIGIIMERSVETSYGENPWQKGAGLYVIRNTQDPLAIGKFKLIEGVPLSYNNYTDIDRLLQTITHVGAGIQKNFKSSKPIALGAKHGNVCGAGVNEDPAKALKDMLDGDQRAIFGGSIITNFELTKELAEIIMSYKIEKGKRILDIILAPSVDDEARKIMNRKNGKLRVFTNPALAEINEDSIDRTKRVRHIRGGRLRQDNYRFIYDFNHEEIRWSGKKPTDQQRLDMIIAWAIGCTSNSNTISIVKDGMLLSNGVGQQDRVTSAELALLRAKNAGHDLKGSAAYSDSFFPFPDGPEILANAGITSIIATRGSVRDEEVAAVLADRGVSFCTLPDSIARGFFGH